MQLYLSILVYLSLTSATGTKDTARQEDHDQPYCTIRYRRLCQGKGRHVGCQFPEPGPGMYCENYSPIQFHNDLKHFITHYINRRRQRIASGSERVRGGVHLPKPELMMMVEWDRELASLAQRLADQCSFVHDDCRATVRYPYAGQTVGEVRWRRSSDSDTLTAQRAIRRVFDAWWGERRRVQAHQLTAPFRVTAKGAVWGHFSQLAVWSLSAVGCGAVRHGNSCPRMLLVCDFSHTNMLGQRTLSPGPLVPCPIHTSRRPRSAYPLLCAPVRHRSKSDRQYEFELEDDMPELLDDDDHEDDGPPETPGPELIPQSTRNVTSLVASILSSSTPSRMRGAWKTKAQVVTKSMFRSDEDYHQQPVDDESSTQSRIYYITKMQSKKTTNGLFMHKLDHEMDARLKAEEKFRNIQRWQPKLSGESSQDKYVESYQTMPPRTERQRNGVKLKVTSEVTEDTDSDEDTTTDGTTVTTISPTLIVRHKWKQTRNRPVRPGASALLNIPITAHTRRISIAVMNFDKEDVDQLFRDTGFNPSWMRERV